MLAHATRKRKCVARCQAKPPVRFHENRNAPYPSSRENLRHILTGSTSAQGSDGISAGAASPAGIQLQPAPAAAASARGFTLTKSSHFGPTGIDCGGYAWQIKWHLNKPTTRGGYIVQMIAQWVNVKDCKGRPFRVQDRIHSYNPAHYPFWEAWKIDPNQSDTGKRIDDNYTWLQPVGEGTRGFMEVRGYARYYDGLALPNAFKVINKPPSNLSPMTRSDPKLKGGSPVLLHQLTASWNCCPGSKSKKTKLTWK